MTKKAIQKAIDAQAKWEAKARADLIKAIFANPKHAPLDLDYLVELFGSDLLIPLSATIAAAKPNKEQYRNAQRYVARIAKAILEFNIIEYVDDNEDAEVESDLERELRTGRRVRK